MNEPIRGNNKKGVKTRHRKLSTKKKLGSNRRIQIKVVKFVWGIYSGDYSPILKLSINKIYKKTKDCYQINGEN